MSDDVDLALPLTFTFILPLYNHPQPCTEPSHARHTIDRQSWTSPICDTWSCTPSTALVQRLLRYDLPSFGASYCQTVANQNFSNIPLPEPTEDEPLGVPFPGETYNEPGTNGALSRSMG